MLWLGSCTCVVVNFSKIVEFEEDLVVVWGLFFHHHVVDAAQEEEGEKAPGVLILKGGGDSWSDYGFYAFEEFLQPAHNKYSWEVRLTH
jgi:hypothetical protein